MGRPNIENLSLDNLNKSFLIRLKENGIRVKDIIELISENDEVTKTKAEEELNYFREGHNLIRKRKIN